MRVNKTYKGMIVTVGRTMIMTARGTKKVGTIIIIAAALRLTIIIIIVWIDVADVILLITTTNTTTETFFSGISWTSTGITGMTTVILSGVFLKGLRKQRSTVIIPYGLHIG